MIPETLISIISKAASLPALRYVQAALLKHSKANWQNKIRRQLEPHRRPKHPDILWDRSHSPRETRNTIFIYACPNNKLDKAIKLAHKMNVECSKKNIYLTETTMKDSQDTGLTKKTMTFCVARVSVFVNPKQMPEHFAFVVNASWHNIHQPEADAG